jgi:ribonuclease D
VNAPPVAARWVATATDLDEVLAAASTADRYFLDTEFHRERTYHPHLALLQLTWPGAETVLIDPLAVDAAPVGRLLTGPGLAVLHAAEQDLEVFEHVCGVVPARMFDTQIAAGFCGFTTPSLATLVESLVGVHLSKGDRLTDWTARPLSESAKAYAAADVDHLEQLHDQLSARLTASGRLAWALDECELARQRTRQARDPDMAWWRIKETRSLRGKARGVAQAVAAWREQRASEVDQPVRQVLPDLAVAGIAHRAPRNGSELREIRGLDERHLRKGAAEGILAAVQRGLELEPDDLRLPPVDDTDRSLRPAVTLLTAWLSQLAHDLHLDPTVLATRGDLTALLNGDPDARLARGWRAELVGEPVRRMVDGEVALAFERGKGLVMEPRASRA